MSLQQRLLFAYRTVDCNFHMSVFVFTSNFYSVILNNACASYIWGRKVKGQRNRLSVKTALSLHFTLCSVTKLAAGQYPQLGTISS